jgi:hypothetical protein
MLCVLNALKYVAKGIFVPIFEHLLEVFEPLLEFLHLGAMVCLSLVPPSFHQLLKVGVSEPEFLEPERFKIGSGLYRNLKGDWPMIRACFGEDQNFHAEISFYYFFVTRKQSSRHVIF